MGEREAAGRGGGASIGIQLPALKAAALLLVALKLVLVAGAGPFMDEAYYWLWGQHPALSYYDHPPLNAWVQGLSAALFGWNRFALRLPVLLSLAGTGLVLWLLARRLAPADPAPLFWAGLVLLLSTPVFFATSAVALPDHLLTLCGLAALYCFCGFLAEWRPGTSWAGLWLGAFWLGLATLAKYNGAFIGIGVGLAILVLPRLRPLLRCWQLWAAAGLAVAMQAPVLAWNLSNGFSSFGFVLGGRHGGLASPLDGLVPLLISVPLFLSPFLLWPMVGFALGRGARAEEAPARAVFWVSTLVMLALATRTTALFHWNLVAYLALLGYAAFHFRNRWLYGLHVLYGVVFLAGVAVNYVVAPVGDVLRFRDEASAWVYGWDEMAETVAAARQAHGARFVATTDYATAALLAFALRDRDVTSLSPQTDQFDFWFDAGAHAGQDAILYTDSFRGLTAAVAARFESVTLIESVAAERFGRPLGVREIHLARGFKGAQ